MTREEMLSIANTNIPKTISDEAFELKVDSIIKRQLTTFDHEVTTVWFSSYEVGILDQERLVNYLLSKNYCVVYSKYNPHPISINLKPCVKCGQENGAFHDVTDYCKAERKAMNIKKDGTKKDPIKKTLKKFFIEFILRIIIKLRTVKIY